MNSAVHFIYVLIFTGTLLMSACPALSEESTLIDNKRNLFQTGADNDLDRTRGLFRIHRRSSPTVATRSELINIHAHFRKAGVRNIKNFTYTGQMRITDSEGGVGVTFYSDYPNSDTYYRLRRYSGTDFHVAPHGTSITGGTTDSGVTPDAKKWYRFKINVRTLNDRTRIRAKVWRARRRQPRGWQIDCYDDSSTRITRGGVGIWSMADGRHLWRDLKVDK